jgi:hypothetical protein
MTVLQHGLSKFDLNVTLADQSPLTCPPPFPAFLPLAIRIDYDASLLQQTHVPTSVPNHHV